MKIFLCLLLFVCFDSSQAGKQGVPPTEWISQMRRNFDQDNGARHQRPQYRHPPDDLSIVGVDMDTPQMNVVRPCQIFDIGCIRKFLSQKSGCSSVQGPPPEIYNTSFNAHVPSDNLTYIALNANLVGLKNCVVNEFYVNKDTNTMVLEILSPNLSLIGTNTLLYFFRKGREPFIFRDYAITDYSDLSLTWIVRLDHGIDLDKGHVYAYLNRPTKVIVGPGLEPEINNNQVAWRNRVNQTSPEVLVTVGPIILKAFVETMICNFSHHNKISP